MNLECYIQNYRTHGNENYLAPGETFADVAQDFERELADLGLTCEQVADSLERITATYNTFWEHRLPGPQSPYPGINLYRYRYDLDFEASPYVSGVTSSIDWFIEIAGIENGNKAFHTPDCATTVSDMLPKMLREACFPEGEVFFGLKAEWLAQVHQFTQDLDLSPYTPTFTPDAWDSYKYLKAHAPAKSAILENQIARTTLMPGVEVIAAPGSLKIPREYASGNYYDGFPTDKENIYWALLTAAEDLPEEGVLLPLAAEALGFKFDTHISHLNPGDIYLIRVFPYFDKQVG